MARSNRRTKIPKGESPHIEKRVFGEVPALHKQVPPSPISDLIKQKLRFRFDLCDERNWALHDIQKSDHKRLIKRLKHFENLTLDEARRAGLLVEYDMSNCPNQKARKILRNAFDGLDNLTRLSVEPSGPLRLFGMRDGHEIHILWWDPKHEVWPEGKIVR